MGDEDTIHSPWHEGEVSLQEKFGSAQQMAEIGHKIIRPFMPEQHQQFFTQIPFLVAGAVDDEGDCWAGLISGKPGFISSPTDRRLDISVTPDPNDPVIAGLKNGKAVGLLGIELSSRRRNRMNGTVTGLHADSFSVTVGQSFGNCPQYIQLREYEFSRNPNEHSAIAPQALSATDADVNTRISKADTFFVSSYVDLDGQRQVDVSHRGGKPGFVKVGLDGTLTIPDYAGNLFFNTLGNFLKNPKAGLIFPDFETGDVLQLTGDAEVILDSLEAEAFEGAERVWTFKPRKIFLRKAALPMKWAFKEYSPNSLMTGSWSQAEARIEAQKTAMKWRPFRVRKIGRESSVIKSFWLEPADGGGVVRHKSGQHLPIKLTIEGEDSPTLRTYTLSVAPSDSAYRISVKRDGLASRYLHDKIAEDDIIEARAPQGNFTADPNSDRPAVMLAAGVGITPFIAMLRDMCFEGHRTRKMREAWLFQAARTYEERAFDSELNSLLEKSDGAFRLIRTLSETDEPRNMQKGLKARISVDMLKAVLPFNDYDFYICGPSGFMESMYNGLRDLNVSDARIFFEAFGPASVKRRPDEGAPLAELELPASDPVEITFKKSGKRVSWTPEAGSLLELAEGQNIEVPFSCRSGSCGSCKTRLLQGRVTYEKHPEFMVAEDEALLCCALPVKTQEGEASLILEA